MSVESGTYEREGLEWHPVDVDSDVDEPIDGLLPDGLVDFDGYRRTVPEIIDSNALADFVETAGVKPVDVPMFLHLVIDMPYDTWLQRSHVDLAIGSDSAKPTRYTRVRNLLEDYDVVVTNGKKRSSAGFLVRSEGLVLRGIISREIGDQLQENANVSESVIAKILDQSTEHSGVEDIPAELANASYEVRYGARACKDKDPSIFLPTDANGVNVAKKICATCVIKEDCLEGALANREDNGVWGGTSQRERRRILKSRARRS